MSETADILSCSNPYQASQLIFIDACLTVSCVISIIGTRKSIMTYYKKKKKQEPTIALTTLLSTIAVYAFVMIETLNYFIPLTLISCFVADESDREWIFETFEVLATFIYGCHWVSFLIALFSRLYFIFHHSNYGLSVRSVAIFVTLIVLSGIYMIIDTVYVFYYGLTQTYYMLGAFNVFGALLAAIAMNYLFIHKLYVLSRELQDESQLAVKNIVVITRISILSIQSSIWTTFLFVFTVLHSTFFTPFTYMVTHCVVAMDILLNVIMITLSMSFARKYYMCLCRCLDHRLRMVCIRLLKLGDEDKRSRKILAFLNMEGSIASKTKSKSSRTKSKNTLFSKSTSSALPAPVPVPISTKMLHLSSISVSDIDERENSMSPSPSPVPSPVPSPRLNK